MGILRRTLLDAALDGRATFLVAGAVLGVGVYGFAVTFKPYQSDRVLQPFHVSGIDLVAVSEPALQPPSTVFPEVPSLTQALAAPEAPGEVVVAAQPRPAAALAPASPPAAVSAAGGEGASAPLPPSQAPAAPRGIGPIEIAPENALVYVYPPRDSSSDSSDSPGAYDADAHEDPAAHARGPDENREEPNPAEQPGPVAKHARAKNQKGD